MQHQGAAAAGVSPVNKRLIALGITATGGELAALWKLMKTRDGINRGEIIDGRTGWNMHFGVLLRGVACLATQHEDGHRQIQTFYYPGDFLGLHEYLFPRSAELSEVQALTICSVGTIGRDELEGEMQRHPAVGRALWRAAVTELRILRQRFFISRRSARQRIAHILCEQLARLGAEQAVIPLSQTDVADAAGVSAVHANRIFQELRQLGVLSRHRLLEVVDRKGLQRLAAFDGGYLDPAEALSRWDLRFEE